MVYEAQHGLRREALIFNPTVCCDCVKELCFFRLEKEKSSDFRQSLEVTPPPLLAMVIRDILAIVVIRWR
jgi:hypothetical protein